LHQPAATTATLKRQAKAGAATAVAAVAAEARDQLEAPSQRPPVGLDTGLHERLRQRVEAAKVGGTTSPGLVADTCVSPATLLYCNTMILLTVG
jgi:hypothetical protein